MCKFKFIYKIVFLLTFFISACSGKKDVTITNSIYCWNDRHSYSYFNDNETKVIFDNNIKKIYCKLTDVVWNERFHAEPTDINDIPNRHAISKFSQIVPCIFFTNEVMIKSTKEELNYMAQKIAKRINYYEVKEMQVDCDWSEKSRDNYFYFIKELKTNLDSGIIVSATIRLYQYKYPDKAGIPPADRGMLMLYNFNSPKTYTGENVIYEAKEAEKYFGNTSYKLPLDFALAHFDWNVLYDDKNLFIGYVNKEDTELLINNSQKGTKENEYILQNDISITGHFARKGQKLITYTTGENEVKKSYKQAIELSNTKTFSIALFDMNERTTNYLLSDESIFKNTVR